MDAKDEEVDIGEDVAETVAPTVIVKDTGACSSPSSSSSSDSSSSSGLFLFFVAYCAMLFCLSYAPS